MKIKSFLVLTIFIIAIFGFTATPAGALTSAQINQQIAQLQAQIAQLLQQIEVLQVQQQGVPANWCHNFNRNLGYAQSGTDEVGHLHTALNKQGISFAPDTGNTYGRGTANAVTAFQEKYTNEVLSRYRLRRGTGYAGTSTRAKLNQLYGCINVPQCSNLWWFDNTNTSCSSQRQFCGQYMYASLRTFSTQQECLDAVAEIQEVSCAENGQKAYGNSAFGPTTCCSANADLKPVGIQNGSMCMAANDGSKGTCIENWDTTCGNGVCGEGEDMCNCSKDCPMPVPMGL